MSFDITIFAVKNSSRHLLGLILKIYNLEWS